MLSQICFDFNENTHFQKTLEEYLCLSQRVRVYAQKLRMGIEPIAVGDIPINALLYAATFPFFPVTLNLSSFQF